MGIQFYNKANEKFQGIWASFLLPYIIIKVTKSFKLMPTYLRFVNLLLQIKMQKRNKESFASPLVHLHRNISFSRSSRIEKSSTFMHYMNNMMSVFAPNKS